MHQTFIKSLLKILGSSWHDWTLISSWRVYEGFNAIGLLYIQALVLCRKSCTDRLTDRYEMRVLTPNVGAFQKSSDVEIFSHSPKDLYVPQNPSSQSS